MSHKPAAVPATVNDPLAFLLLNEVGIISQLSQARATKLLAPALNLSQFVVLNHFERLGGERSLVQVACALQVTKAAMTNTVARLHVKGLVAVRHDPNDGRGKLVSRDGGGPPHAAAGCGATRRGSGRTGQRAARGRVAAGAAAAAQTAHLVRRTPLNVAPMASHVHPAVRDGPVPAPSLPRAACCRRPPTR